MDGTTFVADDDAISVSDGNEPSPAAMSEHGNENLPDEFEQAAANLVRLYRQAVNSGQPAVTTSEEQAGDDNGEPGDGIDRSPPHTLPTQDIDTDSDTQSEDVRLVRTTSQYPNRTYPYPFRSGAEVLAEGRRGTPSMGEEPGPMRARWYYVEQLPDLWYVEEWAPEWGRNGWQLAGRHITIADPTTSLGDATNPERNGYDRDI